MQLTQTQLINSIQLKKYVPKVHPGYVTKPKKAPGTHTLIKLLGQKSFWGCIQKKNMSLFTEKNTALTGSQKDIFLITLGALVYEAGGSKKDLRRLLKRKGCLGFCTPGMIKKAFKYAFALVEANS